MNDLEERLREDLRAATDWIPDDIDPHAVLWTGRRVRRSRLVSRTAVAAALLVVAGLVGPAVWHVLQPTPRVPSPMQTVSAVPSDPATPGDPLSTTFDFLDAGVADLESIRVDAEPSGNEVGLTVTVKTQGAAAVERRYTVLAGEAWHVAWDKHLVIGILPDQVQWVTGVYGQDKKGHYSDQRPLDGIGSTAVWMYFESGRADKLTGFIWQGADGVVRHSDGSTLPSATVQLPSGSYLVYREHADNVWIRDISSGGGWGTAIGKVGDILHGGVGTKRDGGEWEWSQFGLLPVGAHDLELTLGKGDGGWGSAVMTDGTVAVVAEVRGVEGPGDVVRSLSYTDAAGKRVTVRK